MEIARVPLQIFHVRRLRAQGGPCLSSPLWFAVPLLLVQEERVLLHRHRGGEDPEDADAQVGDPSRLCHRPRNRGSSRRYGHHGLVWQVRSLALNVDDRGSLGGGGQRCQRASRLPRLRLHRANRSHLLPPHRPSDATLWSPIATTRPSPQQDRPHHGSLPRPLPLQQGSPRHLRADEDVQQSVWQPRQPVPKHAHGSLHRDSDGS